MSLTADQSCADVDRSGTDDHGATEDRGAILILVLVMGVIGALFILPILYYTNTVLRAGSVPTDKAEAVELAEGGTWVALSRQGALYDDCIGGELVSSLDGVTTTCEVLANERLRDISEVPFGTATVQADTQVPSQIVDGNSYINPSTAADPAAWLADLATEPTAGTVWLPELPVRAASSGGTRDTVMKDGTQADGYTDCRVFFPGTFDVPIDIDQPTYFASGVYYFTEPITIRSGADIVVGNGSELGCATDQSAIASAVNSPRPLNMTGFGGTFVLGGNSRITVDDSAGGDTIRFAMNRRYVSDLETSVAASECVSIISVNGDAATPTSALIVPGVLHVPASTVGTGDSPSPAAANRGYAPSTVTPALGAPDAPAITGTVAFQRPFTPNNQRGRLSVSWSEPPNNGAPITGYTVSGVLNGTTTAFSCSPPSPVLPDTTVPTTCTITGLENRGQDSDEFPVITVAATNSEGDGVASAPVEVAPITLNGPAAVPTLNTPGQPVSPTITDHTDGLAVGWDVPAPDGGAPIGGYRATIIDSLGAAFTCTAWFDEQSCVIPTSSGLIDSTVYDIAVEAVQFEGPTSASETVSPPATITGHTFLPGSATSPAPVQTVAALVADVPPILDLTTSNADDVDIVIAGYIAVPQGRILIGALSTSTTDIRLLGGVLAAEISLEATYPDLLDVRFDNPVAQKRIRLVSTTDTRFKAESVAIVQVNESGSLAINSWVVQ